MSTAFIQWRGKARDHATIVWRVAGEEHRERLGPVTPDRAMVRLREIQLQLAQADRGGGTLAGCRAPLVGPLTFGVALEEFLASRRIDCSEETARYYEKHARHFRRIMPCSWPIAEISPKTIRAYMDNRIAGYSFDAGDGAGRVEYDPVSKYTANKERNSLVVLWGWLQERGDATNNPALACSPYKNAKPAEKKPCPRDVLDRLVLYLRTTGQQCGALSERWTRELYADVLTVLWWTGRRTGELLRVPPSDVGLEDPGGPAYTIRNAPNKGGVRVFPIPAEVVPLFRKHLARRDREGRPLRYVFALDDGGHAYWALYGLRRRLLKLKDSPFQKARHHLLRHGFPDRLREAGVDPFVRARLLGHSTIQTTGLYSHEDLQDQREAFAALSRAKAQEPPPQTEPTSAAKPPPPG